MTRRTVLALLFLAAMLAAGPGAAARAADAEPPRYLVREAETPPPRELAEPVAAMLGGKSVQLYNGPDTLLAELWFRKEVPAQATEEQVGNGLTWREVPETTLVAVLRVDRPLADYRKQKIKPGLYTLRLAVQPPEGDHAGTAPHPEFLLLTPAAEEKSADLLTARELHERSTHASGTSHPCVLLVFPLKDKAPAAAKLHRDADNHWLLTRPLAVRAAGKTVTVGLVLTLIGASSAA